MKIGNKIYLFSAGVLVVMTVAVIVAGWLIISDQSYKLQDRILRLELQQAKHEIFDTLNRSGEQAAIQNATVINKDLEPVNSQERSSYLFIVEEPNRVIYHPVHKSGSQIGWEELDAMFQSQEGTIEHSTSGREEYVVFGMLNPVRWLVGLSIDKRQILAKRREYLRSISFIAVVILLLTFLVAMRIVDRLVHRIQATLNCVKQIEDGDLDTRITNITSNDEIGRLQIGVNGMITKIRERTLELQVEIDRRTQMEADLRINQERLDLALTAANKGVWDIRLDTNTPYFDSRYYTMAGYEPNEFVASYKEWKKRIHPDDFESMLAKMNQFLQGKIDSFDHVFRFLRKNGDYMWVWSQGEIVSSDENNKPLRVIGTQTDIDRQKKAEDELRKARKFISNVIDSMPSSLIGVDINGKVTQWNKTVADSTGITPDNAFGKKLTDVVPWMTSQMKSIKESIQSKQIQQDQKVLRELKNYSCYEDVTIYPLVTNGVEGAVIRIDDVTEQVRLEEILIQNEKMLSVGGLAAGMAHEINNPLAAITQTAQVMSNRLRNNRKIPANQKAAEDAGTTLSAIDQFMENRGIIRMLTTIVESGKRVADIVNNMLSFARKETSVVTFHSINDLLDRTLELASIDYDLKKDFDFKQIEIKRIYQSDLPPIPCEAGKIQQVFLNIFNNGAQAMWDNRTRESKFIIRTFLDQQKTMVSIEIEDNGPGLTETVRKRVFEPFFTTKPAGMGTGLGLSVSYFIITEDHQGELAVDSTAGSGARFIIRLPLERHSQ